MIDAVPAAVAKCESPRLHVTRTSSHSRSPAHLLLPPSLASLRHGARSARGRACLPCSQVPPSGESFPSSSYSLRRVVSATTSPKALASRSTPSVDGSRLFSKSSRCTHTAAELSSLPDSRATSPSAHNRAAHLTGFVSALFCSTRFVFLAPSLRYPTGVPHVLPNGSTRRTMARASFIVPPFRV